ncbi:MAG: disulfide isomerase DsbC N-terminal domain-containing protein, partial [Stenotrophomonas sp.]
MFRFAIAALFGALSLTACAQQPAASKTAATAAAAAAPATDAAVEKRVRDALKELDPNFKPDYIGAAPFAGFREVIVSGQVLYVTDDGRYLLQTTPYDIANKAQATSSGLLAYRRGLLETLPHADRIVFAPPNAKHTISVFTDIECGYCRKLH